MKRKQLLSTIIIIIIIIIININYYFYSYTRKKVLLSHFKPEDIHRPKFCETSFFICHYTDIGNGECQPRTGHLLIFLPI